MSLLKSIAASFILVVFLSSGSLAAQNLVHVVERGETVFGIARLYRVSADELMRFNNITDPTRLQVGRPLSIPSSRTAGPQSFTEHRVVRNDTLFSIARNNGIPLQELLDANGFSQNHIIRVDDIIRIPARPGSVPPPAPPAPASMPAPVVQAATPAMSPMPAQATMSAQAPAQVPPPVPNVRQLIPSSSMDPSLRWPVRPQAISYMTGRLQGVVLLGERSEPVRSLTHGTVVSAGPYRGFGRVAIVEAPGGYLFVYGGFESLSVRRGDRVGPGEVLGRLGIDALSQKPNLFFMVYRGNTPINPAEAPRA